MSQFLLLRKLSFGSHGREVLDGYPTVQVITNADA
jgi:hypothetical protein